MSAHFVVLSLSSHKSIALWLRQTPLLFVRRLTQLNKLFFLITHHFVLDVFNCFCCYISSMSSSSSSCDYYYCLVNMTSRYSML